MIALIKWIGGIVSGIVVAVAVYWLTTGYFGGSTRTGTTDGSTSTSEDRAGEPGGTRVIEAMLRADPSDYEGPCPVEIAFSGRVSVVGGGGTVSYKFLRNDGASAPVETIEFDGPGSRSISTTWRLGAATARFNPYNGWQSIQIFDPAEYQSNRAEFTIRCR